MTAETIAALETPALLLDERRMRANIDRMRRQVAHLSVDFRPHVKTAKCIEVARHLFDTLTAEWPRFNGW